MTLDDVLKLIEKMKLNCAETDAGRGRWKGLDDLESIIKIQKVA